ncbi:MAG: DUF4102 domain-containing protein [Rhizobiales bacterium]|nr:DUF4102 domain-containing protein [Hyphomicrobiales bacterium]
MVTTAITKRILLTDAAVRREPFADGKPRIVRDSKIAGLHLWIGKKTKTFRYQYEAPRTNGRRGTTNVIWLGEHPHHSADQARAKALDIQAQRARGEPIVISAVVVPADDSPPSLTFRQAWELYRAAITKEGKSPRTIADYEDKFSRHLKAWHDKPLATITREDVTREHAAITERARKARATTSMHRASTPQTVVYALWPCGLEFCEERAGDRRASRAQPVSSRQALSQGAGPRDRHGRSTTALLVVSAASNAEPYSPRDASVHAALRPPQE